MWKYATLSPLETKVNVLGFSLTSDENQVFKYPVSKTCLFVRSPFYNTFSKREESFFDSIFKWFCKEQLLRLKQMLKCKLNVILSKQYEVILQKWLSRNDYYIPTFLWIERVHFDGILIQVHWLTKKIL